MIYLLLFVLKAVAVATVDLTPYEAAALGDLPTCCPSHPLLYCDFYFDGYDQKLPVYRLDDGINTDHPLSPFPSRMFGWIGYLGHFSPAIRDSKTDAISYVTSSWRNGTFLECPSTVHDNRYPGNQFYISNSLEDGVGKLFTRAFQRATIDQPGREFFEGRCIYLPLTSITVPGPEGNIQLEVNDENPNYPEERRCVVFKTAK